MITQYNTKLFFWISDLKILRLKILLRVKSDPVIHCYCPETQELTCLVCRVSGQSPPTICCQPPPRLSLAIIEVKLVFIGENWAVTGGSPASKGQLEICHLTQPDICPSTRIGNLQSSSHYFNLRYLIHRFRSNVIISSVTSERKEDQSKPCHNFGKTWIKY